MSNPAAKLPPSARLTFPEPPVSRRLLVLLAFLLVVQVRTDRPFDSVGAWSGARGLRLVRLVEREIRERFHHPPEERVLYQAAVRGMLSVLQDPYSEYMSPQGADQNREIMDEERYAGIGIRSMPLEDGGVLVIHVLAGSPAEEAGLSDGDVLRAVDGVPLAGRPFEQAVDRLRGEVGTTVHVNFSRGEETRSTAIVRRLLPDYAFFYHRMLPATPKIGYVRMQLFNRDAATRLGRAVADLKRHTMRALVLDLRGNAGGALLEGLSVSDLFLDRGIITITETTISRGYGRSSHRQEHRASPGKLGDWPMAVLVDRWTASAAELTAAALGENDRALVVGERTFGKGLVQEVIPLGDTRGEIKLTVGRYLTPTGKDINQAGIEPDLAVTMTRHARRAVGRAAEQEWYARGASGATVEIPVDPQLARAVETLAAELGVTLPPAFDRHRVGRAPEPSQHSGESGRTSAPSASGVKGGSS